MSLAQGHRIKPLKPWAWMSLSSTRTRSNSSPLKQIQPTLLCMWHMREVKDQGRLPFAYCHTPKSISVSQNASLHSLWFSNKPCCLLYGDFWIRRKQDTSWKWTERRLVTLRALLSHSYDTVKYFLGHLAFHKGRGADLRTSWEPLYALNWLDAVCTFINIYYLFINPFYKCSWKSSPVPGIGTW